MIDNEYMLLLPVCRLRPSDGPGERPGADAERHAVPGTGDVLVRTRIQHQRG